MRLQRRKGTQSLPHLLTGNESFPPLFLATPLGTDVEWKNTQPFYFLSAFSVWAVCVLEEGESGLMASGSASVKWTRALTQGATRLRVPNRKSPLHRLRVSFTHFQISTYRAPPACGHLCAALVRWADLTARDGDGKRAALSDLGSQLEPDLRS